MCGIAGLLNTRRESIPSLERKLRVMGELIAHRGPDDQGIWCHEKQSLGFAHQRLSIIDLTQGAHQPMRAPNGLTIVFNGEIYNYKELRETLRSSWEFRTNSDTEVILAAYQRYGKACVDHLKGMFAFALWDGKQLFCARDRFGIKPFYYSQKGDLFSFASEAKALLPFQDAVSTDSLAFSEYVIFQQPLSERTLFSGIHKLKPGHYLVASEGNIHIEQYWDVHYNIDYDHSPQYFQERLAALMNDSVKAHLVSDVPVGCYVSGGIDSSLMAVLATDFNDTPVSLFHGRFKEYPQYDESVYAKEVAERTSGPLYIADINASDFVENIQTIVYHLDYPVAGPGAFPQYMVSKLVSEHVKVVLGGQGGDEIFGGYARYVLAYFEQCIKASIEGTLNNGNFIVTPQSIIPNLEVLKEYKPLIKRFWSNGLFDDLDKRYFSLVNRGGDLADEINWEHIDKAYVEGEFYSIFNSTRNVRKESYFDSMTHFDFKCLLPALLHVEDRVSMAHGIEARVPFLHHPLVEFMATVPANVKFDSGKMKHMLKETFKEKIPQSIASRRDKMGFPVPLAEWMEGPLKEFVMDIMLTGKRKNRDFMDYDKVMESFRNPAKFSRKLWAFLCLELWHQAFHDKSYYFKSLID